MAFVLSSGIKENFEIAVERAKAGTLIKDSWKLGVDTCYEPIENSGLTIKSAFASVITAIPVMPVMTFVGIGGKLYEFADNVLFAPPKHN